MGLIIIQRVSGEWAVNTAEMCCPCAADGSSHSALQKHVCQTRSVEAVTQHKQQKEALKWQTNWLLVCKPLCMCRSPLAITFLQSGNSWSLRFTSASLSIYLTVNPYCCRRTPGAEVQTVQVKHTHTHSSEEIMTWLQTGCLATGCVRGAGVQETRNVNTHTHILFNLLTPFYSRRIIA